MSDWVNRLFNQHKFVRRFMVFWAVILVTLVTYIVMTHMDQVTEPVANVAIAIIGLVSIALSFYQWSRNKD